MSSRFRTTIAALGLSASLLAGCGHGSSGSQPVVPAPGGGGPGTLSVGSAPATFSFTFPKSTSSAGRSTQGTRAPKYLSSATKSITVQVTDTKSAAAGNADIYANVPSALKAVQSANFANLTGNPNVAGQCGTDPSNAGNYKCTAVFQMPIGIDSATIASWDASGGTGNKLSQATPSITIVQGTTNSPAVSLDANAATMTVSGTAPCTSGGSIGSAYGSVGTSPATFTVTYADADGKTIVPPGMPTLAVTATGVSNGPLNVSVNQSAQTFTVTPGSSNTTGTINVAATPPSSDGLTFNQTTSFTFSTSPALGSSILAVAEQISSSSGQIALYNLTIGGSGAADTFTAASPATVAVSNSINESKPDVDTPQGIAFDTNNDLLVANAGNGTAGDRGDLACIPAGAIVNSGIHTSTTTSANADIPEGLAYDTRDGSVALSDTLVSPGGDFTSDYVLSGDYTAAPASRDVVRSGAYTGDTAVVDIPALPAGSYATAVTTGTNNHNGGSSEIVLVNGSSGTETAVTSSTDGTIDDPVGLAWDATNNQLAIVNDSYFTPPGKAGGGQLDFYTVSGTPALVKSVNTPSAFCACAWFNVAASPDGHIAASFNDLSEEFRIQIYDNSAARNAVGGPIPFNGTTGANDTGNYIFDTGNPNVGGGGSQKIDSMIWLSNTKLLVALTTQASGKEGLYIFDISSIVTQSSFGFDDNTGAAFPAFPKNTGFQATSLTPFAAAYKP